MQPKKESLFQVAEIIFLIPATSLILPIGQLTPPVAYDFFGECCLTGGQI